MPSLIAHLWAGLSRPSPRAQTPEQALVRGLAHAVLGAALALLLPWWAVVLLYAVKEGADLRQDGQWLDGGFDVAFVLIGALGFAWWPAAAIGLGLIHAAVIYTTRR